VRAHYFVFLLLATVCCGSDETANSCDGSECTSPTSDAGNEGTDAPAVDAPAVDAPAVDAPADASGDGSTCTDGFKSCNGQCVAVDDPDYGCTESGCEACSQTSAVCNQGTCEFQCAVGTADCDWNPADCETNITWDGYNCGGCGVDCGSRPCTGGSCGALPESIGSELGKPAIAMADDSNYVYVLSGYLYDWQLHRIDKGTLDVEQIGSWDKYNSLSVAVSDTTIFIGTAGLGTEPGYLFSMPKSGGALTQIGQAPSNCWNVKPGLVRVHGSKFFVAGNMYTSTSGTQSWLASGLTSGGVAGSNIYTQDDIQFLIGLAVTDTHVYFSNWGSVFRIGQQGSGLEVLATNLEQPLSLGVDSTNVYWMDVNSNGDVGRVMRLPLSGGTPTTLADDLRDPGGLAIDATDIYFAYTETAEAACVWRVPKSGGTPVCVGTYSGFHPPPLLVDDTHVYWLSSDNEQVLRTPTSP